MIVYHGTTARRARRIRTEGFLPKAPSRKVWFAKGRGYAHGRAKAQARRQHDTAVVLTCNIDINALKATYGSRKVFERGGIIAVDTGVPPTVLRECLADLDQPQTPDEIAAWAVSVLRLKSHKGPGLKHPGVLRLSDWITRRKLHRPTTRIGSREMLGKARQWLPEYFERYEIDPDSLQVTLKPGVAFPRADPGAGRALDYHDFDDPATADPREERAINCLQSENPSRRARGLGLLAGLENVDLFDWCAMHLDDDADVVVAALRAMLRAQDGDAEPILPLAESDDHRIRASATAALTRYTGDDAPLWFERGLKDPSACVRMETCARLGDVDASDERFHAAFEIALYDPNPEIRRRAEAFVAGKGYHIATW